MMKREIKFRGICKEVKGWVYGGFVKGKSGKSYIFNGNDDGYLEDDINVVISETVGQFTGLLDKNGEEIYEGDVLTDKDKNITIVVWIDEWAMFGCMFHDEWELYRLKGVKEIDESMFWTFTIENNQLQVIGNIHENK